MSRPKFVPLPIWICDTTGSVWHVDLRSVFSVYRTKCLLGERFGPAFFYCHVPPSGSGTISSSHTEFGPVNTSSPELISGVKCRSHKHRLFAHFPPLPVSVSLCWAKRARSFPPLPLFLHFSSSSCVSFACFSSFSFDNSFPAAVPWATSHNNRC